MLRLHTRAHKQERQKQNAMRTIACLAVLSFHAANLPLCRPSTPDFVCAFALDVGYGYRADDAQVAGRCNGSLGIWGRPAATADLKARRAIA
jgi:hypothetical protein